MNQDKYIISYDLGYSDWYVSEFYKYFHLRIAQDNPNIILKYVPLRELSKKFNIEFNSGILFNWYSLVIFNVKTEKYFIHSWNDNAPVILDEHIQHNVDLISLSCVTNLKNDNLIEKWKHKVKFNPSVYYLANWTDHKHIKITLKKEKEHRVGKAFFNGLLHSHRKNVKELFEYNPFFEIKSRQESYKQGFDYFDEVSNYRFGLSLNGASNICYRDMELFGMNVLNLRETLYSKTYNPIQKDIHYFELIDESFYLEIVRKTKNVKSILEQKLYELEEFIQTDKYRDMLNEANKWFSENVLPESQYRIISSFLEEFTIFK